MYVNGDSGLQPYAVKIIISSQSNSGKELIVIKRKKKWGSNILPRYIKKNK